MEVTHFYAMIVLIILFALSLVFYGKGLVHIVTFGYDAGIAYIAIVNNWEILFFIPIAVIGIISVLLFSYAMLKGGWL